MEVSMTYKQMCEVISEYWEEVFGKRVDPEHIFQYSATGELYMVHHWYVEAKSYFDWKEGNQDA
jgi:hypothetical protein